MIMKAGYGKVPEVVTAGTGNVALRMPNTHAALQLTLNCPVAAPSANKFGHVSPTTAQHVFDDFHTNELKHVFIVDDGPCKIGIESTVIRLHNNNIEILRTGGVSE
jgi:L-threonylcarbamoyladenylate synthase